MATQQQITAAAFAICPYTCPLAGCDHLHCTPDRSTMEAAKAALEAAERVPAEGLFQLTVVEKDWPSDWQEQFRRRYPRNVSMAAAIRQIEVLKKKKSVTYEVLMAGVDRYAESVADAEMQFVAHPTSWLSACRWLDDPRALDRSSGGSGFAALARHGAGLR